MIEKGARFTGSLVYSATVNFTTHVGRALWLTCHFAVMSYRMQDRYVLMTQTRALLAIKTDRQGNDNKKPATVTPVFLSLQKGGFFRVPAARNSLFPLFFFNHIDGDHVMFHRLIQHLYRRGRIAVFNRHKDFDVRLNTFKRNAQ